MYDEYLSVTEVAQRFRVAYRTVIAWTKREVEPLEAYEVGGVIRIPESALQIFIKPVQPSRKQSRVSGQPVRSRAIPGNRKRKK